MRLENVEAIQPGMRIRAWSIRQGEGDSLLFCVQGTVTAVSDSGQPIIYLNNPHSRDDPKMSYGIRIDDYDIEVLNGPPQPRIAEIMM